MPTINIDMRNQIDQDFNLYRVIAPNSYDLVASLPAGRVTRSLPLEYQHPSTSYVMIPTTIGSCVGYAMALRQYMNLNILGDGTLTHGSSRRTVYKVHVHQTPIPTVTMNLAPEVDSRDLVDPHVLERLLPIKPIS